MQILALPQAWCNSTPPNLSVSSHIFTSNLPSQNLNKLASNLYGEPGFFNSLRSVSTSKTSLRSGLVKVRCGEVKDDRFYMRRCVELARTAIGCTSPNPMVGCVIVKDGKIVGEGFHPKAGQPHAEVFALQDAGQLAENATAYVSLEPCNHYGRTPPCTEALIKAKVKKVVVGTVDPNPVVSSKGVDRLRDAGIDVAVGVEEELCKRLNEVFIHQMLTGKPFVTLRYSLSVNGCFLDQLGEGASESGGYYSQLLQEHDAVIVSASLMENLPRLASQEPGANQPLRIIVARTPGLSSIQIPGFAKETAPEVIVFSNQDADLEAEMAQEGIETVGLDQITLNAILEYCKSRGLCSALLDLRGSCGDLEELLKEGIDQNLLQKVVVEILPQWDINDNVNLRVALNGLGKILKTKNLHPKISDQSIVLEGYF